MPHIPIGKAKYFWVMGINPAGKRQLVGPANTRMQIEDQAEKHELEGILVKQLPTRDAGKASQIFRNSLANKEDWRSTLDRFKHGKKQETESETKLKGELFEENE